MSPISKTKRLSARRSLVVDTVAERMLTWCSVSTRVTSLSSPERSSASIWICTRKTLFEDGAPVLTDDYAPVDTLVPVYHWTPPRRP